MNQEFYKHLFEKPHRAKAIPSNKAIANWALSVVHLLYPEQSKDKFNSIEELELYTRQLQHELCGIIDGCDDECNNSKQIAQHFFDEVPELYRILNTDIQAIYNGDPAARSEFEVIRTYPGFYAICYYRIAHLLHKLNVPLIPRILTEHAHSKTGIDIHPAAVIGEYFHIDHGTGLVIGESCLIGQYVKMYQGVTLGALSVHKNMAGTKRHPTVEDRVIIYSGATILGGETVIGHDSIIGGNVWLTKSVAPHSTVYHTPMTTVQT
ncbi:serine O-acetyltransferase [Mucilaginibacter terrae]|uniref:Serine acetyltransferase n=1 Tax=Mucilaginibacter terrae TaxID=1955052 RepID=A0ABU3GNZ3_9SPHI|nr:serine acetyltransferase [Mucilaginibacter terrae]MDT3401504.1 serine O-acetyltransferase [Mucilaginibacter terrae]